SLLVEKSARSPLRAFLLLRGDFSSSTRLSPEGTERALDAFAARGLAAPAGAADCAPKRTPHTSIIMADTPLASLIRVSLCLSDATGQPSVVLYYVVSVVLKTVWGSAPLQTVRSQSRLMLAARGMVVLRLRLVVVCSCQPKKTSGWWLSRH